MGPCVSDVTFLVQRKSVGTLRQWFFKVVSWSFMVFVGFNGFSRWFHGFWSLSMVNGPRLVKSELSAAGAK